MSDSTPGGDAADAPTEGSVRVVGTAHVSEESVREVERVVEEERPDVVAVELDEGRYRQLKGGDPDDIDPVDVLRGNTVFQFIAYWMLSYVQTRLGERFDVTPGADMLAAVESAERLGVDVALVDRDIQTTVQRFWARMSRGEKFRMAGELAFGVTDGRVVGALFGVVLGVFLGPVVGLFGGALGLTTPFLARVTAGLLLGVAVWYVCWRVVGRLLDPASALAAGVGAGVAAGLVGGVGLGVGADPLANALGPFTVRAVGSLAVGLAAGVVAGGLVGLLVEAFRQPPPPEVEDGLEAVDFTDTDVVSAMMEEFRAFSPGGAEALIDERDAYIAHRLVELRASGRDVVAVVGAGHREGIERYLEDPDSLPPMESLTGVATSRGIPWGKLVGSLLSVAFVGFFVLLFVAGVDDLFLLRLFAAWFVINAVFAAGLAKLAGARWLSALVGGAVAWLTSVNPLLAPGWFAGYMELRHTPVNVGDVGRLNDLISDEEKPLGRLVREMFEVPLFRLIVIVAVTNVGSMVASLLFVTYVLPLFATGLGGVDGVMALLVEGATEGGRTVWRALT
jgi:pheromone shutdown protein TraB